MVPLQSKTGKVVIERQGQICDKDTKTKIKRTTILNMINVFPSPALFLQMFLRLQVHFLLPTLSILLKYLPDNIYLLISLGKGLSHVLRVNAPSATK